MKLSADRVFLWPTADLVRPLDLRHRDHLGARDLLRPFQLLTERTRSSLTFSTFNRKNVAVIDFFNFNEVAKQDVDQFCGSKTFTSNVDVSTVSGSSSDSKA